MKSKLIAFSDKEIELLLKEADIEERSFTETVRRIIDNYFKGKENK